MVTMIGQEIACLAEWLPFLSGKLSFWWVWGCDEAIWGGFFPKVFCGLSAALFSVLHGILILCSTLQEVFGKKHGCFTTNF